MANFQGKSLFIKLIGAGAVLFVLAGFTGCTTVSHTVDGENRRGSFADILPIPTKDYKTLGLVFTENQIKFSKDNGQSGQIFTYYALLKEAQKLGADGIANVVIDVKKEGTTTKRLFMKTLTDTTETWYGAATAIKYTDSLNETTINKSSVIRDGKETTDTVTSTKWIFSGSNPSGGGLFGGIFGKK